MPTWKRVVHRLWMKLLDVIAVFVKSPRPTVFVGNSSSLGLMRYIVNVNSKHILLVTDAMLEQMDLHQSLVDEIEKQGAKVTVFSGIEPDPTREQIEAGIDVARSVGCDSVLGFGGGSSIDAAKVIAAGATNKIPVEKMGFFNIKTKPLPLFAIPTAGTGSEVTMGSVVTDTENQLKYTIADPKLVPKATALEAKLMTSLPPAITAATGVDALTHGVEAFIATRNQPEAKENGRIAINLIFQHLVDAYRDGSNESAREGMALAAYHGGLAIADLGAGYVHGIAHQLGGRYHVAHGVANAVVLPHVLELSKERASSALAELADLIGVSSQGQTQMQRAEAFITAVKALNSELDMPKGFEEIDEKDFDVILDGAHAEVFSMYSVPKYIEGSEGIDLLKSISI